MLAGVELLRSASSILFRKPKGQTLVQTEGSLGWAVMLSWAEGRSACKEFPLRKFQAVDIFLEASNL
jgi:hypothetical protein